MARADVIVVCEAGKGQTEAANSALITAGAKLANHGGGRLVCLLVGHKIREAAWELSQYVDEVLVAESPQHADYCSNAHVRATQKLIADLAPGAVLFGHTYIGMDLAPRLAAKLNVGAAINCFDVLIENGSVYFMRPMYRGRVHAKVALDGEVMIATIQQSGTAQPSARGTGQVTPIEVDAGADRRIRPIRTIEPVSTGVDIAKADVIVSGGRGVGEKVNFALVEDLAAALGGVPACSRPLVDMGWFPTSYQVGLSGTMVKPKLYVACGISGAVEHVHGMKESRTIIAINKDAEAPIFKIANFGIVGDLMEILPMLTTEVKGARTE